MDCQVDGNCNLTKRQADKITDFKNVKIYKILDW